MLIRSLLASAALAALLSACGAADTDTAEPTTAKATVTVSPAGSAMRRSIETATFTTLPPAVPDQATTSGATAATDAPANGAGAVGAALPADARTDPAMVRAQILLDRSRFSPGIVDGLGGENTRQAIAAFEKANALPVDGKLDATVFDRLASGDGGAVLTDYMITAADVAGPFIGTVPDDIEAMARLERVGYATAREGLAEKFHMSEELLAALNPGADFARAGQTLVVASTGPGELPGDVARIVVDKGENSVRAFDAEGALLAFYPATIGSGEMPSPTGSHTVKVLAPRPNYTYDPSRVSYGEGKAKVVVPPGPNNPVGAMWIGLSRDTYGIHGTSDPAKIGKTASSGCVRLTNWDVVQLASRVKPGVVVEFV